jgi:hypothetical protein
MIDWGDDEDWDIEKLRIEPEDSEIITLKPKNPKEKKEKKKKQVIEEKEEKEEKEKKEKNEEKKNEEKLKKIKEKEKEKKEKKEELLKKEKEKKDKKEKKEKKEQTKKIKSPSKAKTRKEPGLKKQEKEEEIKLKSIQKQDTDINSHFWEIVNNYYLLKNKYEKEIEKLTDGVKQNLDEKSTKRDVILKENVKKLVPACVNCRRYVGSIFKTINTELNGTRGRLFSLKCGDPVTPCALNISFMMPNIKNFDNIFEDDNRRIDILKSDIIICKNDLIFDYADEESIMKRFELLKRKLNKILNDNAYSLDFYTTITSKPDLPEMKKQHTKLIEEYKEMINQYNTTKNAGLLNDAIQFYISEIKPLGKQIMNTCYPLNIVENEDETYKLVQNENPISSLEVIGRYPIVYEDLNEYIISNEEIKEPEKSFKKLNKKIMIIPATEAEESK